MFSHPWELGDASNDRSNTLWEYDPAALQAVLVASLLLGVIQDAGYHLKTFPGIEPANLRDLQLPLPIWSGPAEWGSPSPIN